MNGVGNDDAHAALASAVTDLLDLRVDEQVRVAALERSLAERLDLLIEPTCAIREISDLLIRSPSDSTS